MESGKTTIPGALLAAATLFAISPVSAQTTTFQTYRCGDGSEFIVATLAHDFAELDKGPATRLAYGTERAAAIQKKLAGVVAHVERTVVRAVPELTFRTATPSENR